MNFLRKIWIQKLSSVSLLVLFLFIHAVKTFHTHDFSYASQNDNNKNTTVVKTYFFCAICNFQIAKDSDAEVATLNITSPYHFIFVYYNYTLPELYNFSATSSVRGPPANI